jgi:xylose dehydrogenase (NAD/NADP)
MNIKWGFIGAGYVASKALAPAVHAASNSSLAAVASRDHKRAAALAPEKVYERYEDLIADPAIDAVYINLANSQHCQWTIAALTAGKHVLCEKPLAINHQQAKEMADAATRSGQLLIEATWTRWHPRFRRAIELVSRGDIGDLISIESAFTFTADLTDNFRSAQSLGGGSLLDVGTYQLQLWRALIHPWINPTFLKIDQVLNSTGADLSTEISAEVQLANTLLKLSALSSFVTPEKQFAKITGTNSIIEFTKGAAFTSWKESSSLQIGDHTEVFPATDAYQLMIEAVSAKISGEDTWVLPIQESLDVALLLDEAQAFSGA